MYVNVNAIMPMLADAHISSLGYLWNQCMYEKAKKWKRTSNIARDFSVCFVDIAASIATEYLHIGNFLEI